MDISFLYPLFVIRPPAPCISAPICRYDRTKWSLKQIQGVQYVACMNPTAGSYTIDPRCQRHFATFAMPMPNSETCAQIYSRVLGAHVSFFSREVLRIVDRIVNATMELHERVCVFVHTSRRRAIGAGGAKDSFFFPPGQ